MKEEHLKSTWDWQSPTQSKLHSVECHSVFICSIFFTEHPSGELLHILFLAFILCRPQKWCSWCENTKGSWFIRHLHRPQTTHDLSPTSPLNVKGCQIPLFKNPLVVPHVQYSYTFYWKWAKKSVITHTVAPAESVLHKRMDSFTLDSPHDVCCRCVKWVHARKAPAFIDCADPFLFLAHPPLLSSALFSSVSWWHVKTHVASLSFCVLDGLSVQKWSDRFAFRFPLPLSSYLSFVLISLSFCWFLLLNGFQKTMVIDEL